VRITRAHIEPYSRRFATPLTSARGRFTHRTGWHLQLQDDAGHRGHGDAAAWPGFGSGSDRVALRMACVAETSFGLLGSCFNSPAELQAWLQACAEPPELRYAIELATLDLFAQARGCSLAALLGAEGVTRVACHALVAHDEVPQASVLKIKIGAHDLDEDEAHIAHCRSKARPGARLRLDAGGAWTPAEARDAIARLSRYDIEFIEEPLAHVDLTDLASLCVMAEQHGTRIALDESITGGDDLARVIAASAAHAVVLKPMFLGGLLATLDLARTAREAGLEVIVTHALESTVGRAGAIAAAALIPGTHGLDSPRFVAPPDDDLKRVGDHIELPRTPGLGVSPQTRRSKLNRDTASDALPLPLASSAIARPDHPALVTRTLSLSYRQLADAASRCAGSLHARGVRPGMTVALRGKRDADFAIRLHAIAWLGACIAPLPEHAPISEIETLLAAIAPRMVLSSSEALAPAEPLAERFWPRHEPRLIMCTSGSTGAKKPIRLSTDQIFLSATASAFRLGHDPADRWLCCLPLHHIGGLSVLLRAAIYGTTVHLHERFDAERVASALDGGQITMLSLVPQMLQRVLDARTEQPLPSSVRTVLVGGGHVEQELLDRCRALKIPLAVSWGMTEAASQVATGLPGEHPRTAADVGPPLCVFRVDTVGEALRIRGPIVDGELLTSDRGFVDEQQHVHVEGRIDEMIVSGGEKIAPSEVEAVLCRHEAVRHAFVAGLESDTWGACPGALVELEAGVSLAPDELNRWCRRHLASFKIPTAIVATERLPRTELGKIARHAAGEMLRDRIAHHASPSQHLNRSQHASLAQALQQHGGSLDGCGTSAFSGSLASSESIESDEGVHMQHRRSHHGVRTSERVAESDTPRGQTLDLDTDVEHLAHAHRTLEVGFDMHQRHAEPVAFDESIHATVDAHEQLFIGGVTELEHAREKHDPRAVYFKEPRSHSMNEGHDDDVR
jgi:O-succinylbenzoic acid--CoA ligase